MKQKRILASRVEELTGDPKIFERSTEGERVGRIVSAYRIDLNPEQEYFLQMLSLHPRSVSEQHFPVLIQDYGKEGKDKNYVEDHILIPLEEKGLLEVLGQEEQTSYSVHPLMKLIFSTWWASSDRKEGHEQWAQAAVASPDLDFSARGAKSLEELQPYLDLAEHYLEAENFDLAWAVYLKVDIFLKLLQLGYPSLILKLGQKFELIWKQGRWPDEYTLSVLFEKLTQASEVLNKKSEELSYRKKQLSTFKETENKKQILVNGFLLAYTYINIGQTKEAEKTFQELEKLPGDLDGNLDIYIGVKTKFGLFQGLYKKMIQKYPTLLSNFSSQYNKILHQINIAEVYYRNGQFEEVISILKQSQEEVRDQRVYILLPQIFQIWNWLSLKQKNTPQARFYDNKKIEWQKKLGLPWEEDGFLLVAEGQFDKAIRQEEVYLSTTEEETINKEREIRASLILSQACFGKGEQKQAQIYLQQTEALMNSTGCWREKDRFLETKEMLGLD